MIRKRRQDQCNKNMRSLSLSLEINLKSNPTTADPQGRSATRRRAALMRKGRIKRKTGTQGTRRRSTTEATKTSTEVRTEITATAGTTLLSRPIATRYNTLRPEETTEITGHLDKTTTGMIIEDKAGTGKIAATRRTGTAVTTTLLTKTKETLDSLDPVLHTLGPRRDRDPTRRTDTTTRGTGSTTLPTTNRTPMPGASPGDAKLHYYSRHLLLDQVLLSWTDTIDSSQ